MSETSYVLKLSSQSQVTLPRELRERLKLRPGSRLTVLVSDNNKLHISDMLPIKKHFGSLPGAWTNQSEDAAIYARNLRDSMQPKLNSK
jgi:AbrB family looped-hinge helix DNA binding protein